jgi:hypothetical protein
MRPGSRRERPATYANSDWFRKATGASRIKGLLLQRIYTELGKRNKEEKDRNREQNDRRTVALLWRAIDEELPEDWRRKVLDRFHLAALESPAPTASESPTNCCSPRSTLWLTFIARCPSSTGSASTFTKPRLGRRYRTSPV